VHNVFFWYRFTWFVLDKGPLNGLLLLLVYTLDLQPFIVGWLYM